jgi:hypothetical protein
MLVGQRVHGVCRYGSVWWAVRAPRRAEFHDVLLCCGLFRNHDPSPAIPETSIQRLTTKSMTDSTSGQNLTFESDLGFPRFR